MTNEHGPDAIIRRVLGDLLDAREAHVTRKGPRRAVLVLDETTAGLRAALRDANFCVIPVAPGISLTDFETRGLLLAGRVLVTANTPECVDDAPVLDYGIIGLDGLPVIDQRDTYASNPTAKAISRAVTRHRLASRRPAWVIMLVPEGEHVLLGLE